MKLFIASCITAVLVCLISAPVLASEPTVLTPEELAEIFPGILPEFIADSPLPGIYEITVGASVAYVSKDGRYLLRGELIDLETETNVTAQRQGKARKDVLAAVDESQMVIFSPPDPIYTVTVFTDIDCGYCRRMHREMDQLNALGIRVRYLFYPRSGPGTGSWTKANDVWCASDRNAAMTAAKNGEEVVATNCGTTPVREHYELGQQVGLQGTPAVVTDSGDIVGGYLPPDALLARLRAAR
jgi:thiol:disulfide interchange protein DsbC